VFQDAPKAHAVSFEVRVYDLQAGPFEINSSQKDQYFEINGDAIQQVVFTDERLEIEDGGLIMKHWGADQPMHYEKQ
jgi:hypothetical protein